MGKTRDLSKKTTDTKGIFHIKMGTIKDRNSKDLIEVEEIKMRWQEYTELYKKGFNDPDNHDNVVIHLKPDILECEVKWALGSITTNKASGGVGIPAELSQIKEDKVPLKAALNMPANLENLAVATGVGKVSFHSNPKERQCQRMFNLWHNCTHFTC